MSLFMDKKNTQNNGMIEPCIEIDYDGTSPVGIKDAVFSLQVNATSKNNRNNLAAANNNNNNNNNNNSKSNKTFYISQPTSNAQPLHSDPKINQLTDVIPLERIPGLSNGVYVWILGRNMQGEQDLWMIKSLSKQEIGTKHIDIVLRSKDKINAGLSDHVIQCIQYAGEMSIEMHDNDKFVYVNLLSGTYMDGKIDARNIPEHIKDDLIKQLNGFFGSDNAMSNSSRPSSMIHVLETGTSFIDDSNHEMTYQLLREYAMTRGLEIRVFTTPEDARKYKKSFTTITKLTMRLEQNHGLENKFGKTERTTNQIQSLKNEIKDLESFRERHHPISVQQLDDLFSRSNSRDLSGNRNTQKRQVRQKRKKRQMNSNNGITNNRETRKKHGRKKRGKSKSNSKSKSK